MYIIEKISVDMENGSVNPECLGTFCVREEATRIMRKEFCRCLAEFGLEENGGCTESGESAPGGYCMEEEAVIYDNMPFALEQLLERVVLVVQKVN